MTPSDITKLVTLASDLARPSTLPILSHLVIGSGKIVASDLESQITIAAPFHDDPIAVPAARFKTILSTLPADAPISLTNKDRKLTIKSGRSKSTIHTMPADSFPWMELEHPVCSMTLDQASLKAMLHDTQHAIAQNNLRPGLNGLLVDIKDGTLNIVASDGNRLAMSSCPTETQDAEFILPRNTVARLVKLLNDGMVSVQVYESKSVFTIGDIEFITKLVVGKYPPYSRIIPNPKHKITIPIANIMDSLSRASVVLDKVRACRLSIGDTISITCSNSGEVSSDEFAIDQPAATVEIGLNPDYLRDALSACGGEHVTFGYTDEKSAVMVEGGWVTAVVMTLRN